MRRNSTLHVCLNVLMAAWVLYGAATPGEAGQKSAGSPDPMAEVIVYVAPGPVPGAVSCPARVTAGWIYARAGIRLLWRDGKAPVGVTTGQVTVQVRYAKTAPAEISAEALAYAKPFSDGTSVVTILYDRVCQVAGRESHERSLLAHVLAHELGHVLQRSTGHARTGVMKAHWTGEDFDAMERMRLTFTDDDVDLLKAGLNWCYRNMQHRR
jgi:hypothetical protein